MKEKDKTTQFLKWAKAKMPHTFAFEAKICKKPSLPFSAVKPHQERALKQVADNVFAFKISDAGFIENPFDGIFMTGEKAYIVIFWYQYRGDKRFVMIDIDVWLEYKENCKRKSITYGEACRVGHALSL